MMVCETGIGSCKVKVEKTAYGDILCSFRKTGNRGPAGEPEDARGQRGEYLQQHPGRMEELFLCWEISSRKQLGKPLSLTSQVSSGTQSKIA